MDFILHVHVMVHRESYFQTELRSDGYLLRFFSSSSRASWMHSLVDTLVKQSNSWRASLMSRDESWRQTGTSSVWV